MSADAKGPHAGEPPDFRKLRGMDPAANWLLDLAAEDYLSDEAETVIPFLIELGEDAVEPFRQLMEDRRGATVLGFGQENLRIREDVLLPVVASREWLLDLLDDSDLAREFQQSRKRIKLSSPMTLPDRPPSDRGRAPASPGVVKTTPGEGGRRAGVVVAAIDDGFAFAHERFRAADGTSRIEFFWDMNRGAPPQGERTAAAIDAALVEARDATGSEDEDRVYCRKGALDFADPRHKPLAWRASHGTHVLDLAAGSDPGEDGPPMIAVQLPTPVVARTTGELLDFYVWYGTLYALHRAEDRPLLLNISFGYVAGAHDGLGPLEDHLGRLVAGREAPTAVVLPAGNAQLSRCHAAVDLSAAAAETLDWIVQPDDRTHSIVEIWLPPGEHAGQRMTLEVAPPDGTPPASLPEPPAGAAGLPAARLGPPGAPYGLAEMWERGDGRRMYRIAIAPTARAQPSTRRVAPAGAWKLRLLQGPRPPAEPVEVWVQRDDSLYGYPQRGRQSYLEHDGYRRFDDLGKAMEDDPPMAGPVTRKSLVNAIATGAHVLVAGGYRERDRRLAPYSAGGPTTPAEAPPLLKPDALLPSDGSRVHAGMLGAGARSGARLPLSGTSVAAPQLVRHLVGWLAQGGAIDRAALAAAAQNGPGGPPAPQSADRAGHGRLPRLDPPPAIRFEPGD